MQLVSQISRSYGPKGRSGNADGGAFLPDAQLQYPHKEWFLRLLLTTEN
jgi:hypothetical protein